MDLDAVIIDTAGRLHTKKHLMDELENQKSIDKSILERYMKYY
jgi:signal recognition particle GTPase